MVRNLEKNVSKEKARRSFPGYLRGRESGGETHTRTEISGIRRNSLSTSMVYECVVLVSRKTQCIIIIIQHFTYALFLY